MALERDYEVLETLGEGSFGKVYKATQRVSGDLVAVKQIKLGSKSWDEALKSMELQALRALRHPFLVRLRELMRSPQDGSLYYVFEFVGSDLFRFMREHPKGLEEQLAAELGRQLLAALAHMHQFGFFHRDVKPENILMDVASFTIRLADFGETRSLRARPPFTDYVGTRWYRAPECLLRFRAYSSPVDVWAAGLVLAELLRGAPVFCGTSALDQLYKIFQVFGSQATQDWPEFRQLAGEMRFRVPEGSGCGLGRVLPGVSPLAQAAVQEVLVLNPRRRPPAKRLLEHPFFAQLPPLDLERDCRSAGSSAAPSEPGGCGPAARRAAPGGGYPQGPGAPTPPPAPVLPAAQGEQEEELTPPPSRCRVGLEGAAEEAPVSRAPSQPASQPPADDLDLDAELDAILGSSSTQPIALKALAGHDAGGGRGVGLGLSEAAGGADSSPPGVDPTGTLGSLGLGSLGMGSFSFTPFSRTMPRDNAGEGGDAAAAARQLPERLRSLAEEAPAAGSSGSGATPCSPGASVDMLLDDLCADLGMSPARSRQPARAIPSPSPAPAPVAPKAPVATSSGTPQPPAPRAEALAREAPAGPGESSQLRRHREEAAAGESDWDDEADGDAAELKSFDRDSEPDEVAGSPPARRSSKSDSKASRPWSKEEAAQLRRAVRKVPKKRDGGENKKFWQEVCQELGGGRSARECKQQYTEEYSAHKSRQKAGAE